MMLPVPEVPCPGLFIGGTQDVRLGMVFQGQLLLGSSSWELTATVWLMKTSIKIRGKKKSSDYF